MVINILQYLEKNSKIMPDKIALADENASITYYQYMKQAKIIGTYLLKNVTQGKIKKPIAVLIDRNIKSIISFMGCVYSGNFYVPIDSTMPKERVDLILKALNPIAILDARIKGDDFLEAIKFDDIIETNDINELELLKIRTGMIDTDPLYAIFTSGSTGIPKGVLISHKSVIDLVEEFSEVFQFSENLVWGNQAPFDFDVSVKDIYNSLKCGGTVEVIPKKLFMMPVKLIEYLNAKKINTLIWAVSALRIVSDFKTLDKIVPEFLKHIMFSGECMPVKALNYWMEKVQDCQYINLYGPTEITCNCTYYEIKEKYDENKALPIGNAFPNTRIILLDEDRKVINEVGRVGEICVEGTCLALGYWNAIEKTRESFIQNPEVIEYDNRLYATGDLAYYNDNYELVFATRKDYQIKHMGHRIELGELEVALNAISFIDVACCIFDEDAQKIVCFYQSENEDSKEIVKELGKKLPKYMWPNKYICYKELPLNKNGKIDRIKLKEEYGENYK